MTVLIIAVLVVLAVSALCSLTEAALYAVRMPFVRQLAASGSAAGRLLTNFKSNMEKPITAILILNTIANTAGAAVAGGQARQLFGEGALIWFSAAFTLAVLFFSEIMPKIAGVAFNRPVATLLSRPLHGLITAMYPLVWLSQRFAAVFRRGGPVRIAPEEEVWHFAAISAEEGSILPFEAELVRNVLQLNDVTARDIMTPRTVVVKLPANLTVKELAAEAGDLPHSRIPIYAAKDPDNWTGVVLRRNILAHLAADRFDVPLEAFARPISFVPDTMPGHLLLNEFLKRRQHLLGVVDESGVIVGVVTLEDVLESLIGKEIVDETDLHPDMQEVARKQAAERFRQLFGEKDQTPPPPPSDFD